MADEDFKLIAKKIWLQATKKQFNPLQEKRFTEYIYELMFFDPETKDILNNLHYSENLKHKFCNNPITNEDYCDVLAKKKSCEGCEYNY
jgi:hypothetical protein